MITVANVSAGQAASYHEKDDYYTKDMKAENGESLMPAKFAGRLAERLGLGGEYSHEKFKDALHGKFNDQQWVKAPSLKRAGMDCTFSAPKSYSMQALVKGDTRLVGLFDKANAAVMRYVESLARCRLTSEKVTTSASVGEIAYASFRHETSRKAGQADDVVPDPNLHIHNVILKAMLGEDGKLRALDNSEILLHQFACDAIGKQVLAAGAREFGYKLVMTKDGFEFEGYTKECLRTFSKRTVQIDSFLEGKGMTRESSSAASRQVANKKTNNKKQIIDRVTVVSKWRSSVDSLGFRLPDIPSPRKSRHELKNGERKAGLAGIDEKLRTAIVLNRENGQAVRVVGEDFDRVVASVRLTATEAVAHAIKHLTERSSVIKGRSQLLAAAMLAAEYYLPFESVSAALDLAIAKGEILIGHNGHALVSIHSLNTERRINDAYKAGMDAVTPMATMEHCNRGIAQMQRQIADRIILGVAQKLGRDLTQEEKDVWYAMATLSEGQASMVRNITTESDRVNVVEGDAGTGKSTAMEAVKIIAQVSGFQVLGLAPSKQAVEALADTGIQTITLQRGVRDSKFWDRVNDKTIIVLDEAGLVDAKAMDMILAKAQERGARIVAVGDTKQYGSVESGAALEQLKGKAEQAGKLSSLDEMRRGKNEFMKDLHFASRDNTEKTLDMLYDKGCIMVVRNRERRIETIAKLYAERTEEDKSKTFILTGKNVDRIQINSAVRTELGLSGGQTISCFEKKDLTEAEVMRIGSYETGDIISFTSNSGAFRKNERLTVLEKRSDRLVVAKEDGSKVEFRPNKQGTNLVIGTEEKIELARGDRIRFTANAEYFSNGDRGMVLKIEHNQATVRLDKDNSEILVELSENRPLNLRYAYALTGHSAQGATKGLGIMHIPATTMARLTETAPIPISRALQTK